MRIRGSAGGRVPIGRRVPERPAGLPPGRAPSRTSLIEVVPRSADVARTRRWTSRTAGADASAAVPVAPISAGRRPRPPSRPASAGAAVPSAPSRLRRLRRPLRSARSTTFPASSAAGTGSRPRPRPRRSRRGSKARAAVPTRRWPGGPQPPATPRASMTGGRLPRQRARRAGPHPRRLRCRRLRQRRCRRGQRRRGQHPR
jgi:hypothetical protein